MVFRNHTEALEVELIRSLFYSLMPTVIMSVAFVLAGALIVDRTGDGLLLTLVIVGALVSLVRIAATRLPMAEAARLNLTIDRARELQRRFTIPYFAFAIVLGLFGDRVMRLPNAEIHMLTTCLLMGYGAGVAASIGLRPRIAIPSMLMAIVPGAVSAMARPDVIYWAMALLTAAFLCGGIDSVRQRHARAVKSIGRRITFAMLARRDSLTELPNRLALREWYDETIAFSGQEGLVAVHYLDLNGFKPVNDSHGHPVGDALLTAVGKRIGRTIRESDMAARLGGDEFAVIQRDIQNPEEAALLARRLVAAIARPFRIDELNVAISTCVGYVISHDRADDLEQLLGLADEALYASKRGNRGVNGYELAKTDVEREAA